VPALAKLLDARSEVRNPSVMRALLDEAGAAVQAAEPESPAPPPAPEPRATDETETGRDLLDALVAKAESSPEPRAPRRRYADPELDSLIAQIAEASDSGVDFAGQDRWREAIDRELAARMRAILHHPAFRALEANWGALRELVRSADTDGPVRIRALHLTRDELLAAASGPELERLLYEDWAGTPGRDPLSLFIAAFAFGDVPEELDALRRLGDLATRAGVLLLAAAAEELAATDREPSEGLAELRASAVARRIGLCYPRVLQRLPYGPETEPIERFEFDEAGGAPEVPYLWASPALAVGRAVARAVSAEGELAALPRHAALQNLPFHVYRSGGDTRSQHAVEHVLNETAIKELVGRGLLPVVGLVGSDEARLVSLRSLAGPSLLEA
jgi:type VI secretion system protein ImpC